ncbi:MULTISPECIES: DeoR/GlpR family DNA-binding transcription regulator [Neisseria]|uniref:DeoR C terminal sensor domain protein n=1 Tax=Neisseria musculi TaxID=1815583 RepID=A0A7H1MBQ2_9NEIS|nr:MULTISPECIES: DeoR/GlpR family DNA-binding transcription regulator [Neisseria]MBF0804076.1 DeoR/GlpR transcriptional regulator [Neisseria sp. 19428wB4_WF04]QNT59067.1 deoR C terminal sensor domain protein [Neisseria musculi]TFU43213.1 DeoR/GlpR transcriptional regulator [Neisseria sp. WF04]
MPPRLRRHEKIIALVREHSFMPIEQLARELDVTPQTIRRDINQLCEENLLRRYHGGATLGESLENEDFNTQKAKLQSEKAHIADLIAEHIPDNASLFLSIGSTIEAVAMALVKKRKNLCIITNNIHVAAIVSGRSDYTVIITSGVVRPIDGGVTGVATVDFINQFKTDYAVLSASGIDADGSLLDFDYKEVSVMQAMIANARICYLGVDHSKFGRNALVRIGSISEFDAVFTDRGPDEAMCKRLEEAGVKCLIADNAK